MSYTVKGIDNDGPFEGSRRYNDFFHFRNSLVSRWPGVYFPPIPPKKKVGNKEMKFLEERRFFLERFLQKLANINFVLVSEEFKIFSRLSGDIEKSFASLPKMNSDIILDRFRSNFNIDESPSQEKNIQSKAIVSQFIEFFNQIIPVLDTIKQ